MTGETFTVDRMMEDGSMWAVRSSVHGIVEHCDSQQEAEAARDRLAAAAPQPTTPLRQVRFVRLPQAGYPRIVTAPDALATWYEHASCSIVQFVEIHGRPKTGLPEGVVLEIAADEEGKMSDPPKPPNPWTLLLFRGDIVGDACLLARDALGRVVDVPEAWARELVERLCAPFDPQTAVITDPADPRLSIGERAFLDPTGGVSR